jgi:hypothetical protein
VHDVTAGISSRMLPSSIQQALLPMHKGTPTGRARYSPRTVPHPTIIFPGAQGQGRQSVGQPVPPGLLRLLPVQLLPLWYSSLPDDESRLLCGYLTVVAVQRVSSSMIAKLCVRSASTSPSQRTLLLSRTAMLLPSHVYLLSL